jgi:hypothetical protein
MRFSLDAESTGPMPPSLACSTGAWQSAFACLVFSPEAHLMFRPNDCVENALEAIQNQIKLLHGA